MAIYKLDIGDTIFEITGFKKLYISEYTVKSVIFTGYSYILPEKAVGKYEFFESDFGTILFSSFNDAYKQLLAIKEIKNHGKHCNNN